MALKNSVTTASIINSDELNALDLDRVVAGVASGSFLPPSYYSSNIVEQQIGSLEPISIDFKGSAHRAATTSSGLLGDFVPPIIEALPLNLGYIRSAAYSITEACYQLSYQLDKPLNNDELKIVIAKNIVQFFEIELARIQSYIEEDNVELHPTLSERFDIVTKILNAEIGNINEYIISNEVPVQIQSTKGSVESVYDVANDKKY